MELFVILQGRTLIFSEFKLIPPSMSSIPNHRGEFTPLWPNLTNDSMSPQQINKTLTTVINIDKHH